MENQRFEDGGANLFELLEILAEAVTIRGVDESIIYANRAARERMGFSSVEELRGRTTGSIMGDYLVTDEHGQPLTSDDLPSVRLLRGEPVEPLLMRTVNRTTGDVQWQQLKATELRNAAGELVAAVTVIENMTELKLAEMRTRLLAESGRLLASSLDYQQTLRNVATLAVPALADWCVVDLVDERLRRQNVATAHRDPNKVRLATRLRELEPDELDPEGGLGRVVRTGVSELFSELSAEQVESGARSDEHLRLLRALELRSAAIVPMRVPGRIIGVMTLVTAESHRRLTKDDLELAEQLARRAAVAVENARLHTTLAGVARTLQQSLLPDEVPEVPDWEIAAMYLPAGAGESIDVGGDFYDVFKSDPEWFAVIGDVTGKGVTAAALTAVLRNGARFASRYEPRPASILARLDESLRQRPEHSLCTVLCALLRERELVLSSAGHPPALIVSGSGAIREAPEPGPLLGAFADSRWSEETISIAQDELILLHTDGVTETPGVEGRFGVERLKALLEEHAGSAPKELLRHLGAAIAAFSGGSAGDDIAALALRPRGGAQREAADD